MTALMIVCAREREPLPPGQIGGYVCHACNVKLMVSRTTLGRVRSGGGLKLAEALQARGKIASVDFGPGFLEELKVWRMQRRGRN